MKTVHKSAKLANVCYDIRGPIMDAARQMEEDGHKIIKLNIGNLAVFGFDAPEEIQQDMIRNLPNSAGYSDSKGIFAARKAVMHETQKQGIKGVTLDDIYLGNGASELIVMATNALLDTGDELLLPSPDYPLWTAAASLSGGTPVHYLCDEANGWMPDLDDIRSKVTPRTKGIVVINPNNPTGALYSDAMLKGIVAIAREHGLVIFADEVYDKVLYDGARHTALGSLSEDVLTLTFNSLSKSYRSCGYRAGWLVVSGDKKPARDYIEGLNMLSNMRLCANVPGQWAVQTALGGYQSINELVGEGGRLLVVARPAPAVEAVVDARVIQKDGVALVGKGGLDRGHRVLRNQRILPGVVEQDGHRYPRCEGQVARDAAAVIAHCRVGLGEGRGAERHLTPQAVTQRADLAGDLGPPAQHGHGSRHIGRGLGRIHRAEQLEGPRAAGLVVGQVHPRREAPEQVGRQHHVAVQRVLVGQRPDMFIDAPDLLDQHDPRPAAGGRQREITRKLLAPGSGDVDPVGVHGGLRGRERRV